MPAMPARARTVRVRAPGAMFRRLPHRQLPQLKASGPATLAIKDSPEDAAPAGSVADSMSNPQLLRWMFRFLAPVKPLVFLACFYLAAYVGCELLAVRQTGQAIDHIQHLTVTREISEVARRQRVLGLDLDGEGSRCASMSLLARGVRHARAPTTPLRDIMLVLVVDHGGLPAAALPAARSPTAR